MGANNSTLSDMSKYMLSSIHIESNISNITNKNGEFQYFICVLDFSVWRKNDTTFDDLFKKLNIPNKITPLSIYIAKQPNLNTDNIWDMVLKKMVYAHKSDMYDLGDLNQAQIKLIEDEMVKPQHWSIQPFDGHIVLNTVISRMIYLYNFHHLFLSDVYSLHS